MLAFSDRLATALRRCGNPVLVGLDPRADMLPAGLAPAEPRTNLKDLAAAYGRFCREVIDVVAPLVPAVKPQAAFFEQLGPLGMAALAEVVDYARRQGLLVILDGKRNDIGSTAAAYAQGCLGQQSAWGADALTVSPYLGDDSLQPFVNVAVQRAAGVFVLVKTSNPGGRSFKTSWPTAGRCTAMWRPMSRSWPVKRSASAAMGRLGPWWGRPIRPNWPNFAPRCRTHGSLCPVSEPKAARWPTSRRPSMSEAAGQSSTTPAASSLPTSLLPTQSGLGLRVGKRPSRQPRGR